MFFLYMFQYCVTTKLVRISKRNNDNGFFGDVIVVAKLEELMSSL